MLTEKDVVLEELGSMLWDVPVDIIVLTGIVLWCYTSSQLNL